MLQLRTSWNRYGDGLDSETVTVVGLERTSFDLASVGIVPEGESGCRPGGPLVPGPWGFAVTHALVIDNHGGSARERDAARKVQVGEPFTFEKGLPGVWCFASPRRNHLDGDGPRLVPFESEMEV